MDEKEVAVAMGGFNLVVGIGELEQVVTAGKLGFDIAVVAEEEAA